MIEYFANKSHINIFIGNRSFDYKCETYYEVKINKIEFNNIFIGFVDSTQYGYEKAFEFGNFENKDSKNRLKENWYKFDIHLILVICKFNSNNQYFLMQQNESKFHLISLE